MHLCVIPGQQNTGTAVCISRYLIVKHIYTGQDRYQIQLQVQAKETKLFLSVSLALAHLCSWYLLTVFALRLLFFFFFFYFKLVV